MLTWWMDQSTSQNFGLVINFCLFDLYYFGRSTVNTRNNMTCTYQQQSNTTAGLLIETGTTEHIITYINNLG